MSASARPLTEGGRIVAELVGRVGATEFGRRVKTTEGTARHLAAGRRLPAPDLRKRIHAAWGVALESWARPAEPTKPTSAPAATDGRMSLSSTVDEATANAVVSGLSQLRATLGLFDASIREAQAQDAKARETENGAYATSGSYWVSLLRGRAAAAEKLARLQGEGELTMAMIVRSRAWREVLSLLRPILERHPEVATEIADVLEALDGP